MLSTIETEDYFGAVGIVATDYRESEKAASMALISPGGRFGRSGARPECLDCRNALAGRVLFLDEMARRSIEPGWGTADQLPNVMLTLAQFCLFAVDDLRPSLLDQVDEADQTLSSDADDLS